MTDRGSSATTGGSAAPEIRRGEDETPRLSAAPGATAASSRAHITRVSGALAEAGPMPEASLYELVRVGERQLLGEVIRIAGDTATIQVYEDTTGLRVGEAVSLTGSALTIELGPGLLGATLDGVGRPLRRIAEETGDFIQPGATARTLDASRRWKFEAVVRPGDRVSAGDVLGTVEERPGIVHRIMVPPDQGGAVARVRSGPFTIDEPFGELADGTPLRLAHRWPVRSVRPVARRLRSHQPFLTGQRIFDLLFPVAEGGAVVVPGGFGTGKTVIEQSLAKFAAADIVVYVGCGERGNEMAEVLNEFPRLTDPATGRPVIDRTVLVVNTSNMPVAARETSVFLGIAIAEYYRDMGYRVAVMADSLSRWAEALREIGARLQEMPGEEGYPTYLGNRLGKLFERAGRAEVAGRPPRTGAVTFVAAISPPGGDFSEPVTQAALRVASALWALDPALAHQRQFPAVDWETSYTLAAEQTAAWFTGNVGKDWGELRRDTLVLLQRDRELRDIAALIGPEALQDRDRLVLEAARVTREVVLGQSAYDPNDERSPIEKTHRLASLAQALYRAGLDALDRGVPFQELDVAAARHALMALRGAAADRMEELAAAARQAIDDLGRRKAAA
ncbi:MAG: V-type ATP synthase subunit A [Deltaproteobacteria bacterium]|nr:V-type ATP synthase subunit A [Deltaproteobacteria bacterium]